MARPTTTNYHFKKSLQSDPANNSGIAESYGPVMDATLDAIDTAIAAASASVGTPLDTDVTLAANSDAKVASQKATKAYVTSKIPPTTADPVNLTDNSGGAVADGTIAVFRSDTLVHLAADASGASVELSTKVNAILAALRTAGILV